MTSRILALLLTLAFAQPALSSQQVVHTLQAQYQTQGAKAFSAEHGKSLWMQEVKAKDGKMRSCTACHGKDLTQPGQHIKTKKVIKPMAPSVNPKRLSDEKKVHKWLTRNCRWTWGRLCTPQEKGDILEYLMTQ